MKTRRLGDAATVNNLSGLASSVKEPASLYSPDELRVQECRGGTKTDTVNTEKSLRLDGTAEVGADERHQGTA